MFKRLTTMLLVFCAACGFTANALADSSAEIKRPGWELTAHTLPTFMPWGRKSALEIRVVNVGAAASSGTVTVTDTLPPGVKATEAGSYLTINGKQNPVNFQGEQWDCTGNAQGESPRAIGSFQPASVVTCVNDPVRQPSILGGGGIDTRKGEASADPELALVVEPEQGVTEGTLAGAHANHVTVSGGGAAQPASVSEPVTISNSPPPFGFAGADTWFSNSDGTVDAQAGSHPYEAAFSFDLNTEIAEEGIQAAGGEIRNLNFNLPPGLIGNPTAVPECPMPLFVTEERCPPDTQVGLALPTILGDGTLGGQVGDPVFNLVPQVSPLSSGSSSTAT